MQTITLALYAIKRICRRKPMIIILCALPLISALLRVIFAHSHVTLICAWACLFVCLAVTGGVFYLQNSFDKTSGLYAGLRSAPITRYELIYARILAGLIVFALQAAVFLIVLSIRYH